MPPSSTDLFGPYGTLDDEYDRPTSTNGNHPPTPASPPPTEVPRQALPEPPPQRPPTTYRRPRRFRKLAFALKLIGALLVFYQIICASLIFIDPIRTNFMLFDPNEDELFAHQHVDIDHVSRYIIAAAMLHEDAQLGLRTLPFDHGAFYDRAVLKLQDPDAYNSGSTIPQQLVKNLFLWRHESIPKKALEALMTYQLNLIPDKRLMELYLNTAEYAKNLYGICAATWYYYDAPPWDISKEQAITLAGMLPAGDYQKRSPKGGLDISVEDGDPLKNWLNAREKLPIRFEEWGGWLPVTETIGITDTAADHAGDRGSEGSCSTMPQNVADRIMQEGLDR